MNERMDSVKEFILFCFMVKYLRAFEGFVRDV